MIALTRNFYIFTTRLTACLAAVLLAVRNIAAAWNVRTFLILLDHHNSSDRSGSGFSIFCSSLGLPFSCTAPPHAVAVRGSPVLLCMVIAIKIPSGDDKRSGCC